MRRRALLTCLLLLSACAIRAAADDVEVQDLSDVMNLQQASRTDYATNYDVIRNSDYVVQLSVRNPGTKSPPFKHQGSFFSLTLDDGTIALNRHPEGKGVETLKAGRVELSHEPSAGGGATLTSSKPLRRLVILAPPVDDVPATEEDLQADDALGKRAKKAGKTALGYGGNVDYRVPLKYIIKPGKPLAVVPMFVHNAGREGIRPSLVVLTAPHSWPGSKQQDTLWIPLEGKAEAAYGGQKAALDSKKVLRLPRGYEDKVTFTPKSGRFVALVIGVGVLSSDSGK